MKATMDKPRGRPFKTGNHPMHDMAAAGRKGKARSPWAKYHVFARKSKGNA